METSEDEFWIAKSKEKIQMLYGSLLEISDVNDEINRDKSNDSQQKSYLSVNETKNDIEIDKEVIKTETLAKKNKMLQESLALLEPLKRQKLSDSKTNKSVLWSYLSEVEKKMKNNLLTSALYLDLTQDAKKRESLKRAGRLVDTSIEVVPYSKKQKEIKMRSPANYKKPILEKQDPNL